MLRGALVLAMLLLASPASAASQANILGLDPHPGVADGVPILTMLLHLEPDIELPEGTIFTVTVGERDLPSILTRHRRWIEPPVLGTAWIIVIDEAPWSAARGVAGAFVDAMAPADYGMIALPFDGGATSSDWLPPEALHDFMSGGKPSGGRERELAAFLEEVAATPIEKPPLRRAMVVISDGEVYGDPGVAEQRAVLLRSHLTGGRLRADRVKTPVPLISIALLQAQPSEAARRFMEGIANPEIGGAHHVLAPGDSVLPLVQAVDKRFDAMHVLEWRVPCLGNELEQSMTLVFRDAEPPIAGDSSFRNVSLGIEPAAWPLDIDREATLAKAPVLEPGSRLVVYGTFCWGSDDGRAMLQLLVPGASRKESKALARAQRVGDGFAEFALPDTLPEPGRGAPRQLEVVVTDAATRRSGRILLALPPAPADEIANGAPSVAPAARGCACTVSSTSSATHLLLVALACWASARRRSGR